MSDKKVQICIGVTDGKRNKVKKEDESKPQNHNLVFSNRVGHSEHAYKILSL